MKDEDPMLAGLELGGLVPHDVHAAGKPHDDLLGWRFSLMNGLDLHDRLPPLRIMLATGWSGHRQHGSGTTATGA